jgi:hypothetical protein
VGKSAFGGKLPEYDNLQLRDSSCKKLKLFKPQVQQPIAGLLEMAMAGQS